MCLGVSEVAGKAFEPQQKYENADGTPITFNVDYLGEHRGADVIPGPFATKEDATMQIF